MHNSIKLAIFTLILIYCKAQSENDVIVDIPELGKIKGLKTTSSGVAREYVRFLGIPYATGIVGEGRFAPAAETGRLVGEDEVFDATFEGESCVQPSGFSFYNPESHNLSIQYAMTGDERIPQQYEARMKASRRSIVGGEECLNLNIHTPNFPWIGGTKPIPVVVFIHGGAFTSGNGYFYNPGKLFKHNVLLVTINYRLGVLGFFSLDTNDAPGNAAIYDMLSALRWVQKYIHHFGGDPNMVTVMGQSAGGAGVSHLMMSPLSKTPTQLFHRAIVLSSSALLPWAITTESPLQSSLRIAELAECYDPASGAPDVQEITRCMKLDAPAVNLVTALNAYQAEERQQGRLGVDVISPIVQRAGEIKVIPKDPQEVLENEEQLNIPLMMGAVRHEGTFPLGIVYNRFLNCPECGELHKNETFLKKDLIPTLLRSMGVVDVTGTLYDELAEQYLGDRKDSGNFTMMTPGLTDIHSVFFFKEGAYRNLKLHSKLNKDSYWYSFDQKPQFSFFEGYFPPGRVPPFPGGVAHGDDIPYYFHFLTLNEENQAISDAFMDYYRNFIYTGNPNVFPIGGFNDDSVKPAAFVNWPAYNSADEKYLIAKGELSAGENYEASWVDASLELEPPPPVETTEAPVETTEAPVETTEAPVETTDAPVETTDAPVETTPEPLDDVTVDIPELGRIKGAKAVAPGVGREYVRFLGIPYATGTLGEGRFSPAAETGRLVGEGEEFDATMEGESCVQPSGFSFFNPDSHNLSLQYALTGDERIPEAYEARTKASGKSIVGSEDCLVLNIHTPRVRGGKPLPVVVFIHGGAFTSGNGFFYNPGKLFKHNVLLVTINYRLGVLGFFSLDTNDAPGNAALYDMLSSLRWVQKYIHHFGGDPNLVTVMGQSAGGAGVSHLVMSPLSKTPTQLFHRAIVLSASALLPWGTAVESPFQSSLRIAELAECYDPASGAPDVLEITRCMKHDAPAVNLVTALNIYQAEERRKGRLGVDVVSPIVQRAGEIKLIPKKPNDVMMNGEQLNIPLMMGAVRHEGTFPLGIVYNRFLNCPECGELHKNETFLRRDLIPTLLRSMGVIDDTGAVYNALASQYLGDRKDSGNFTWMTPGLTDIHSVFFFKAGAYRNLELHSRLNPNSYWYSFDQKPQFSFFESYFPPGKVPPFPGGVAHGDDIPYYFHFLTLNEENQAISDAFMDYYRNFMYTGNPNVFPIGFDEDTVKPDAFVNWPAFNSTTQQFIVANREIKASSDYVSTWVGASLELEPQPDVTTVAPELTDPTSVGPSEVPSVAPSVAPSEVPSVAPSEAPSVAPSEAPSVAPSDAPSEPPVSEPPVSEPPNNGAFRNSGKMLMAILPLITLIRIT